MLLSDDEKEIRLRDQFAIAAMQALLSNHMQRPDFVSEEDIARWANILDNDTNVPKVIASPILFREVLYAGLWLAEQLTKEGCHNELIVRIQYTMGGLSFGRDTWQVAQEMLEAYTNNDLEFEIDYSEDL